MATQSITIRGEARRAMILEAARACFLRDGFHATSMQDLLRATGLSAGAFYRYFPSKESLVDAIAAAAFDDIAVVLSGALTDQPFGPHEMLCRVVHAIERIDARDGTPRLAVQFWGEAQRNPQLAERVRHALGAFVERFGEVVVDMQALGALPSDACALKLASTMLGFVQGFMVQHVILGVRAQDYCDGLPGLGIHGTS